MATRDMTAWETSICKVVSHGDTEEIIVRGHRMSDLIGQVSFSEMMFLMLQGRLPTKPQARTLDALLVASIEHGIAPPSMIARCYASYGTSIQSAIGAGVNAFGDRMGGLGEQMARMLVERLGPHLKAGSPDDALLAKLAGEIVAEAQRTKARVPGYGIPLHSSDPRAPGVLAVARKEGVYGAYCRLGMAIEAALIASARRQVRADECRWRQRGRRPRSRLRLAVVALVSDHAAHREFRRALHRGAGPGHDLAASARRSDHLCGEGTGGVTSAAVSATVIDHHGARTLAEQCAPVPGGNIGPGGAVLVAEQFANGHAGVALVRAKAAHGGAGSRWCGRPRA